MSRVTGTEDSTLDALRTYHGTVHPEYVRAFGAAAEGDRVIRRAVERRADRSDRGQEDVLAALATEHALRLAAGAVFVTVADRRGGRDTPGGGPLADLGDDGIVRRLRERVDGASPDGLEAARPPSALRASRVPETDATREALARLLRSLSAVGPIDATVLGRLYEAVVPACRRKVAGEFYTDDGIARTAVRWALPDGSPDRARVLDPAVGSGAFLLAAGERIDDGGTAPDRSPVAGGTLVGVDVNRLPLHLTGLAAACRSPDSGGRIDLRRASFFDLHPADVDVDGRGSGRPTESGGAGTIAPVDAVVGNPPFVRAESLEPDRAHYRRHLEAINEGDRIGRRSDASVYFVTHATRFLRDGGRLAVVLPSKWLASEYGTGFQAFLRANYRLHAVVSLAGRAFPDVLVDTVLLLAERCRDASRRDATPVRFHRVDGPVDATTLLGYLRRPLAPGGDALAVLDHPSGRTVARRQGSLDPGKLDRYVEAPPDLLALLDGSGLVPLSDLAVVSRGVMTGANRFFFLDRGTIDRWDVDDRFLRPACKSLRECDRPVFGPAAVDRFVLDIHEYVVATRDGSDPGRPDSATVDEAADVTRSLRSDGHGGLADYISYAESEGWHRGRTCERRPMWFDLGPLHAPDLFVPKLLRERVFPIRNRAEAIPSNAIDGLAVRDGVDADVLSGVLLSSLAAAAMEVRGRNEAGMLQLMTYETGSLPVPDVRRLDGWSRRTIRRAATRLSRDPSDRDARSALDAAVLAAIDVDPDTAVSGARLREMCERLRARRLRDRSTNDAVIEP